MANGKRPPIGEESVTVTLPLSVANRLVDVLSRLTDECHDRVRRSGADSATARAECDDYSRCATILRNAILGRWPIRRE